MKRNYLIPVIFMVALHLAFCTTAVFSQTTEFSYQGFLSDASASANGNFDFEFRLFENVNGGVALATQPRLNVPVTNGVFSVVLDFGSFPSANRFLEIAVRPAGGVGTLVTLAPRSKILSTPYSTNAVNAQNAANAQTAQNALQLDGTAANQFVLTGDVRLSNARNPLPGSPNYIQNSTTPQTATNFNVSGNGTAGGTLTGNTVNATTQFNIGGLPIIKQLSFNLLVGLQAGFNNTTGDKNSFFGTGANASNTTGSNNSSFGVDAGRFSSTGSENSFFGAEAGRSNTTGSENSFYGYQAGENNASGFQNSYFGFNAGKLNTGSFNTFLGSEAGEFSTEAEQSTFVGSGAGQRNTTGRDNSFFGVAAGAKNTTGNFNSFFGSFTGSSGSATGTTTGTKNSFFGAGAGGGNTTGNSNTAIGYSADVGAGNLANATAIGANAFVEQSNTLILGSVAGVNDATATPNVGIGTTTPQNRLHVNGIIRTDTLGIAGSTSLCRNASNQISTCSSSLRYKTDIAPFASGLNLVNQLKPITFNWKAGGMRDLGLGAEDVEKVEPLLITYNDKGEVEGVKYDRVAIVLLNAVKEQQAQIEQQENLIEEQKNQLSGQRIQIEEQKKKSEAQQIQLDGQAAAIEKLAMELRSKTTDTTLESNVKRNEKQ
jgi:hypothetical protein